MNRNRIETLIEQLELEPHPEGGYFREIYRSLDTYPGSGSDFPVGRSVSTAIYYLLGPEDVSHFHRIRSDEIWHHYEGGKATVHVIHPDGRYQAMRLGKNLDGGEEPQLVVPANAWFGVTVDEGGFILAGCTVAPGFDFGDFEMADRDHLLDLCPDRADLIRQLTVTPTTQT